MSDQTAYSGFLVREITEVFKKLHEAIEPIIKEYRLVIHPDILKEFPHLFLSIDQQEQAYRAYAIHYNARHPQRKVSWRRLNRNQRREAALEFLGKRE